jgi:hypothetical protein
VRFIRHTVRRGIEGSWRIGLQRTDAPIVFGYNGRAAIDPDAILQLIKKPAPANRPDKLGGNELESGSRLIRWLSARALADEPPAVGGFCILRREAELPIERLPGVHRIEGAHRLQNAPPAAKPTYSSQPASPKQAAPRPSFLARLQNLALGE